MIYVLDLSKKKKGKRNQKNEQKVKNFQPPPNLASAERHVGRVRKYDIVKQIIKVLR